MKPVIRVSSIDQLLRCHASRKLAEWIVSKSGVEANDGNYIHWQTGDVLINQHGAFTGSDFTVPKFPDSYTFAPKDSWVIDACVSNALSFVPNDWCMIVEDEFAWEYENFILVGHIDLTTLSPCMEFAGCKDWKTGTVFQDAADVNYQILGYGILTWRAWPTINWMKLGIFQPRAFMGDDGERDSEELIVGKKEFENAEKFLVNKIDQALEHWYMLETGPKQCRWCDAFLVNCPGIKKEINRMKMHISENDLSGNPSATSDETLGELLHGAKVIGPRIDDVTYEAKERLKAGTRLTCDGKEFKYQSKPWGKKVLDMGLFMKSIRGLSSDEAVDEHSKIGMEDARRVVAKAHDVVQKTKVEGKESAQKMIEEANEGNLEPKFNEMINVIDYEEEEVGV